MATIEEQITLLSQKESQSQNKINEIQTKLSPKITSLIT